MTTTTLSSTSLPSSAALPLTTTINQPTSLQLQLRRRKRQLNSDLYCLKSLALCCPFPFNCLVCGGLALSACPGSRNAKLRVLLALTGRSKDYLWVAGKAAGWFGLFAGLAFTATYQLKVWRDEQMYGVRSGRLSSLLTSPSPSTMTSLTPSLQFSSWLIAGALILILSAFALGLWHFKKVKKRRRRKVSKIASLKTTTRRVLRRIKSPAASANV